jgi:FlaG/FlaF family flagellin (archaellin)
MHKRLPTAPTGAGPFPAARDRGAQPALGAAASIAVGLALIGASAGVSSAAHAQVTGFTASSIVAEVGDPVPFYVVQTSFNGQQEFLFEIAQRFLGDGNRFNEIFELNKGRTQPDGTALTTPTSLLPGWILQLPADAQGDGVQVGPLPGSTPSATQPRPGGEPTNEPAAGPGGPPASTPTKPQASPAPAAPLPETASDATASASGGVPVVIWIIAAIVVLAGAAAAVLFGYRRRNSTVAAPQPSIPVADRSSSWTIDSALKILVAACDDEQIRFPGLYTVTVDNSSVHVLLSSPSAKVPAGWTASSDGRTWSAPLAYLQHQRVPDVSNQEFSRLVTLGTAETGRILIDFHHAKGAVSVEGSTSAVTDVVEGWLSEFVGNPWSGTPQVVRLGPRNPAGQENLESFLARVDGTTAGIAVLDNPPTRLQGEAIRTLYSAPDFGWIFIVKDTYAGATWRFTARDGLLTSELVPDVRYSIAPTNRQPTSAAGT